MSFAENGILMSLWYSCLTKVVGTSVRTPIVLLKCLLDQIFFSTQQNGIFLGLCAMQDTEQLTAAIEATRVTFLTTWINDCAVWPLINFVGFAYVPTILQPTYMSCVQFFWQTYVSSVACGNKQVEPLEQIQTVEQIISAAPPADKDGFIDISGVAILATNALKLAEVMQLKEVFNTIDADHSGFLDPSELKTALQDHGVYLSDGEILTMVTEADENSDGLVSFPEFVHIAEKTNVQPSMNGKPNPANAAIAHSKLWQKVVKGSTTIKVQKGALSVLKTMEEFDAGKQAYKAAQSPKSDASVASPQPQYHPTGTLNAGFMSAVGVALNEAAKADSSSESGGGPDKRNGGSKSSSNDPEDSFFSRFSNTLKMLETPEVHQTEEWKEDRSNAQSNAKIGIGILCAVAVIRVVFFKL
jgi:hypothetical protein